MDSSHLDESNCPTKLFLQQELLRIEKLVLQRAIDDIVLDDADFEEVSFQVVSFQPYRQPVFFGYVNAIFFGSSPFNIVHGSEEKPDVVCVLEELPILLRREKKGISKTYLDILLKDKILFKKIRIIKMCSADQFDRMVAPLSHAPNAWNSHGEENKPLHPL